MTAVEYLEQELKDKVYLRGDARLLYKILEKAKKLERQQIIEAYKSGKINQIENSEIYYTQTYKNDKQ